MSTKLTNEQRADFVHLRATGLSYSACAKKLGIARVVLLAWGAEMAELVNAERACELQALIEQAGIARVERVKILAALTKQAFTALTAKAAELDTLSLPQLTALALGLERRLQAEGEPAAWTLPLSASWDILGNEALVLID